MAIGKSGYFDLNVQTYAAGTATVRFWWQENYDAAGNFSTITITNIAVNPAHAVRNGTYTVNAIVTAGGVTVADIYASVYSEYGYWHTVAINQTSGAIYHDAATGAKTVTLTATLRSNLSSNDAGWTAGSGTTANSTVALTTIPRLSELSAVSGTLGTAQTLTVTRKSTSYTHTITYTCGSASGTICTKSSSKSLSWTPPLSLASENTTGTSVSVKFTITTYSGSTAIGSNTKTVTCTIPTSIKPVVSDGWVRVAPYNTGTKAAGIAAYVQGYSKAQVTFDSSKIDMSGAYGATIKSYRIIHNGASVTASPYRTGVLTAAGSNTVTCRVYDTRGRYASVSLTIAVEAYAVPALTDISVYRSNSVGTADDEGVYISVLATANISSIGGLNAPQLQARYGLNGGSYGDYTALTSGVRQQIGGGNVLTTMTYMVELLLTDALGNTASYTQLISTAEVMFHGRDGGKGGAFGKYAEEDDLLDVDWSIRGRKNLTVDGETTVTGATTMSGGATVTGGAKTDTLTVTGAATLSSNTTVGGKTILNTIYPVGSIYVANSADIEPAALFGGTWSLVAKDFKRAVYEDGVFTASSNLESYTARVTVTDRTVYFYIVFTPSVDMLADNTVSLGNFNYEAFGLSRMPYSINCFPAMSDVANGMVMVTLNYSSGELTVVESIGKNTGDLTTMGTFYMHMTMPANTAYMDDDFCEKFYWQRTA